jgi:hypothetical protein
MEDTGLFSINSGLSSSAGPSPTGIGHLKSRDDWRRSPPHYNSTSGTISRSDYDSTESSGYSFFSLPVHGRSSSMTTCSSRPPPSHRPVGSARSDRELSGSDTSGIQLTSAPDKSHRADILD